MPQHTAEASGLPSAASFLIAATPPFEAQPRIIYGSPAGKAKPFRHVRRQGRAEVFDPRRQTSDAGSQLSASRLQALARAGNFSTRALKSSRPDTNSSSHGSIYRSRVARTSHRDTNSSHRDFCNNCESKDAIRYARLRRASDGAAKKHARGVRTQACDSRGVIQTFSVVAV